MHRAGVLDLRPGVPASGGTCKSFRPLSMALPLMARVLVMGSRRRALAVGAAMPSLMPTAMVLTIVPFVHGRSFGGLTLRSMDLAYGGREGCSILCLDDMTII
jgi:hypothetical protein